MSNKYTTNKNAIADCDVCGFQFKLKKLKDLYVRKTNTHIKACPECWNPDQPQNMQGMYPVEDPQAVRDPRPDKSFTPDGPFSSRDIQWGWNPVGSGNLLAIPDIPDNLKGTGGLGTVTVTITQEKDMAKENQTRKPKMVDGFAQPQDVPVPNFAGYPEKDIKTTGVETRGNGAATKGTKARGPMA